MISIKEYTNSDDYKERVYSYTNKRQVDDLASIVYKGNIYNSSRKLYKALERDYGKIKRIILRKLWQYELPDKLVKLGVLCDKQNYVTMAVLKVGNEIKMPLTESLLEVEEDIVLEIFTEIYKIWQQKKK